MRDFQFRLSQRKLDEKPYSFPDQILPLIQQEDSVFLPSNISDEPGVPVPGAGISEMKLPKFQPTTVTFSDIAPQGPNDSDEDYTPREPS